MKIDDPGGIPTCDLGSLCLLIVADQARRRRSLNAFVDGCGISKVREAESVVEAVDILRREKIDIAIMDLRMSPSNSLRTADFLTRSRGGYADIIELIIPRTESDNCTKCVFLNKATVQFVSRLGEEAGLYEGISAAFERIVNRKLRGRVRLASDSRNEDRIRN